VLSCAIAGNKPSADEKTPKVKPSPTLVLESARSNENTFSNGEFVSILRGNVVFVYDDMRIRSDEATWWRTRGAILFQNNVRAVQKRQVITCDRLNFTKDNNLLVAQGRFVYYDSTERSKLCGDNAEYQVKNKTFKLTGKPVLIRYDTVNAETLTIRSTVMRYVDSLKRATGDDKVEIRKGKLFSTCSLAHYFTNTNQAYLRGKPIVIYDIQRLNGDSINMNFKNNRLHDAYIVGNSHGIYTDTVGGKKGDTSITHIWGDSLYMAITDSGRLEVLWAVGKASSKSYETNNMPMANTASGKKMQLNFGHDGTVRKLRIWGNARSTYFVDDSSGRGCNEVSGDSIAVAFAKGKARFVTLAGSTRGIYFPLQ
jgi:lipopolysaccharide export system protein LptA